MIDPSIPLQVKTPNLAQVYMQAQALKNGQQQQQMNQISLAQAMRQQQDQADTDEAFRAGGGDQQKAIAFLQQKNPRLAAGMQAQLQQQQAEQQKQADEEQARKLKMGLERAGFIDKALQGVTDATSYARAKASIAAQGIPVNDLPEGYDPAIVQTLHQQTLSYGDKIKQQMEQTQAAETARHNTATEATAAATQAETAKYHNVEAGLRKQEVGIQGARLNMERQKNNFDQDASIETMAQQIAIGDLPAPPQSRTNPRNAAVWKRALEINPKLSTSLYTATQDLRSSKPNSMGGNVGRLGTAILHADEALNGSHELGFSQGLLTGIATPGTSSYRQSAEFLTGEIGQYVEGGKLTNGQGNDLKKDLFSSRQSVRDAAIHKIIDLSGGKLKSQMEQFKNATRQDFPTDRVFNDPTISGALRRHGIIDGEAPARGAAPVATHRFNPATGQIEAIK